MAIPILASSILSSSTTTTNNNSNELDVLILHKHMLKLLWLFKVKMSLCHLKASHICSNTRHILRRNIVGIAVGQLGPRLLCPHQSPGSENLGWCVPSRAQPAPSAQSGPLLCLFITQALTSGLGLVLDAEVTENKTYFLPSRSSQGSEEDIYGEKPNDNS